MIWKEKLIVVGFVFGASSSPLLAGCLRLAAALNPPTNSTIGPLFHSIHKRNFISISFVGFHFSLPRSFWLLGAGELIDSIPLRGTLFICFISFHKRRRVCFHSISSIQFLFSPSQPSHKWSQPIHSINFSIPFQRLIEFICFICWLLLTFTIL